MSSFQAIPNELIALILDELDVPSLLICMQVTHDHLPDAVTTVSRLTFRSGLQAVAIHYTTKLLFVVQDMLVLRADVRCQAL